MRALADESGAADTVVVNTCAVTAEAVRQARQTIRRIRRERPDARIIATGCAAQTEPGTFDGMAEVDHVAGNAEKMSPAFWRDLARAPRMVVSDIMEVRETASHLVDAFGTRTRAFVEVQNGCDHRCTFCIIPYGRGPSRSVPMGAVVDQIARLVAAGHREVVLTGVDLTSYGTDLPGAPRLGDLVQRILAHVPDLPRLRISSIDSIEVDEALLDALAETRLMPHLHLSLQAGDDMVLKRMKRRHLADDAVRFCEAVRARRPDVLFGADIIAGFPTETEAMFENTLSVITDCGLSFVHVFPFSPREGTPAARMPQVPRQGREGAGCAPARGGCGANGKRTRRRRRHRRRGSGGTRCARAHGALPARVCERGGNPGRNHSGSRGACRGRRSDGRAGGRMSRGLRSLWGFGRRKGGDPETEQAPEAPDTADEAAEVPDPSEPRAGPPSGSSVDRPVDADETDAKGGWFSRIRKGLAKSSNKLGDRVSSLFTKKKLDAASLQDLEDILIEADLGVDTAMAITDRLSEQRYSRGVEGHELQEVLAEEVERVLSPLARPLELNGAKPFVLLVVGVNGTGKTTTIGKIAAQEVRAGKKVVLAAGDTFRAAAVEQLQVWGERAGAKVVSGAQKADAAGLVYEALDAAQDADLLIVDTAGRLQNKAELMSELEKIVRVVKRRVPDAPHATLLTLDATTGQNAMSQVDIFRDKVGVSGLAMTKLDGTARGGILVAIGAKHQLPIYYVGVGEGIDDLAPFEARDFARAIAGL